MKDRQIVKQMLKRDESALRSMENEYRDYIFKLSLAILGDARDAEECLNETLLAAWNSIPPNRPDDLRTYLAKLARRISINRARKNYSQKRISSEAMVSLDELDDCLTVGRTIVEPAGSVALFYIEAIQNDADTDIRTGPYISYPFTIDFG